MTRTTASRCVQTHNPSTLAWWLLSLFIVCVMAIAPSVNAHDVSPKDAALLLDGSGTRFHLYLWLGAKHMITGLDHVLFLVGVMFYLARPRSVLVFATLFALGHTITLVSGVLAHWQVQPHLVDAIIGASVAYKGFDNLGGFDRFFGERPAESVAVFVFGLFHGLGLATKLQDLGLPEESLVVNLLAFNLGVEAGQVGALIVIVLALKLMGRWRQHPGFAVPVNAGLICVGVALCLDQISRFYGA